MCTKFTIDLKFDENSKFFLRKKRNKENNKSTRSNSLEKIQNDSKNSYFRKRNSPAEIEKEIEKSEAKKESGSKRLNFQPRRTRRRQNKKSSKKVKLFLTIYLLFRLRKIILLVLVRIFT